MSKAWSKEVVVQQAEKLKEQLWVLLEEFNDPPFDIRGTMNQLIDEIESLESDGKED